MTNGFLPASFTVRDGCPKHAIARGPPLLPPLPRDALAAAAFATHRRVRSSSIDSGATGQSRLLVRSSCFLVALLFLWM